MKSLRIFIFVSIFMIAISGTGCGILEVEYVTFDLAAYNHTKDAVVIIIDGDPVFPTLEGDGSYRYKITSDKEVSKDNNNETIEVSITGKKILIEELSEVKKLTLRSDKVNPIVFKEDDWE